MVAKIRALLAELTIRDLHVYGGLALGYYWGAQLSAPWTGVIVGALLVAFGVFVPRRGGT